MKKQTKKEIRKDRVGKGLIQFYVESNQKREFQIVCIERGLKATHVLQKLVVDFCRSNETKPLR